MATEACEQTVKFWLVCNKVKRIAYFANVPFIVSVLSLADIRGLAHQELTDF